MVGGLLYYYLSFLLILEVFHICNIEVLNGYSSVEHGYTDISKRGFPLYIQHVILVYIWEKWN